MRSPQARVAIIVGTIAAVVILFIVLSGDDSNDSGSTGTTSNTTKTSTTTGASGASTQTDKPAAQQSVVVVKNGKPQGGVKELSYTKGDPVRLVVRSDVADEIHVHGYDVSKDVEAGGSVKFSFPADIEGVFEIELEDRKEQIAELRVSPS
jgi:hypothetical protein